VEILFWSSIALAAYTYFGYPLLIALWARARPPAAASPPPDWPPVAVVMAVHNERRRLPAKLDNLAALGYPGPVRIYVTSDGSDDGTVEYLRARTDVTLFVLPERRGKPSALNLALEHVTEDIVVFMDARQDVVPGAVEALVARLLAPGTGAVSGELVHRPAGSESGRSIGLYWKYEKWIRKNESRVHSVPGVTGALYAIRRSDFRPLPPDTILDDFEIPARILRSGRRVVLEEAARAYDIVQESIAGERARKVRTLCGNFQSFARNPWLFLPWKNPIFFQFVSHKALRLVVPYALAGAVISSAVLPGPLYGTLFWLQAGFYALAAAGMGLPFLRHFRAVSVATVFTELNLAAVIALARYVAGRADARWVRT